MNNEELETIIDDLESILNSTASLRNDQVYGLIDAIAFLEEAKNKPPRCLGLFV